MEANSQSLYRIYRPLSFTDVAGHENVVEIIQTQLNNQNFSHAFLFSGQRGTGKTSMARILAKAVNCLSLIKGNPCNQCENCLAFNDNKFVDLYEIDAASNNGVDEIRNIKVNIATLPIIGKYKVYIIDEVHMLTKGAFNALLKTLEEPPAHAIFILATTEYDKIPQTIISRCQTFNFKKITSVDLQKRLSFISKIEGYQIEDDVYNEIYAISEGSLRDALNVLEQLMIIADDKKITINNLKKIFYVATKDEKITILINILNKESNKVITYFEKAKSQGMDFDVFTLSLIKIIKEIIEYKITKNIGLCEELEKTDIKNFLSVELTDLFLIADNLTEAYTKTRNNSVSFDYIILSILKSIQTFSKDYSLEKVEIIEKVVDVKPIEKKVDLTIPVQSNLVADLMDSIEKAEDVKTTYWTQIPEENVSETEVGLIEPTIIENFISEEKPKAKPEIEIVGKTVIELINLQSDLVLKQDDNKQLDFLIEDLINVLRGAVFDQTISLRKDLNTIIANIFTSEDGVLVSPIDATNFALFYNSKIVVANKNELILTTVDSPTANAINYWLLDQHNRDSLFKVLGHDYIVYVISEQKWTETKLTHNRLKEKETLPSYQKKDLVDFYQAGQEKTKIVLQEESQEILDKVANLFNSNDIKIG